MDIDDIKLGEISILVEALKCRTLNELSRRNQSSPGQISKQIQRIERKTGRSLLVRNNQGVQATAELRALLPIFEQFVSLKDQISGDQRFAEETLSIATSSFLAEHLLPLILKDFDFQGSVRVLEIPTHETISHGIKSHFTVCLHTQTLNWPQTWTSHQVGELAWSLYSRADHPLALLKDVKESDILKYPFVVPVHWEGEGFSFGNDLCPIPLSRRRKGHEVNRAGTAMELIKVSQQIAFLPNIAVKEESSLTKIKASWRPVFVPVYLSVKSDRVKQKQFELMKKTINKLLQNYL